MPLNEDDFEKIKQLLTPLETKVDDLTAKVGEMGRALSRTLAPDADDLAKVVTVAIKGSGKLEYGIADGHGLLVSLTVGDETTQKPCLFLLSAAHVVIDFCEPGETVCLEWSGGGAPASREFRAKEIYLDPRYIQDGNRDIGAVLVEPINPQTTVFEEMPVRCCSPGGNKVGQLAVGHGLVYLDGRIVLENIHGTPRVMIDAISVPGCSGCPMFTHEEAAAAGANGSAALYSFLHGHSKHRHSRVAVDEALSHLFADSLQMGALDLRPVSTEKSVYDALKEAEQPGIEEAPGANSQEYTLVQENCPSVIRRIAGTLKIPFQLEQKFSIDSIMNVLATAALPDGQPSLVLGDDPDNLVLRCMVLCPEKSGADVSPEK